MSSAPIQRLGLVQKGGLIALGLVLSLVLIEVSLQATALAHRLVRGSSAERGDAGEGGGAYRVLCLGESTTAPFFGVVAYDRILERLLNERGLGTRFRVINAGYAGRHTSFLLEKLPELLAEYDPQMVILMMGINDHLFFDEPTRLSLTIGLQHKLLHLRTYRLFRILRQHWVGAVTSAATSAVDPEHLQRFRNAGREALETWKEQGPTPETGERLLALIEMAREASRGRGSTRIFDVPEPYLQFYQKAHEWLAEIYRSNGRKDAAIALLQNAIERHPRSEYFHRKLAGLYEEIGEAELAREYRGRSESLASRELLSVTRVNYRSATEMLQTRGVQVVVMQYPMRRVEPLRDLLVGFRDVLFVDNEDVFRGAVARHGYHAVFRDRFAGDFGHCTRLDNRLIAENLVASVFEPFFGSGTSRSHARSR